MIRISKDPVRTLWWEAPIYSAVLCLIVGGTYLNIPLLTQLGVGLVWLAVIVLGGLSGMILGLVYLLDAQGRSGLLRLDEYRIIKYSHRQCAAIVIWALGLIYAGEITLAGLVLLTYVAQFMIDKTILK